MLVRESRGRPVRHHVTYELALHDGRILRTRISRPGNTTTYGAGLWRAILHEQLDVSEDEFWACVEDRQVPDRGQSVSEPSRAALPAGLVHHLIHVAGVAEDDVRSMTLAQALSVMTEHWSQPRAPE